MSSRVGIFLAAASLTLAWASSAGAVVIYSAAGANAVDVLPTVNGFRAAMGTLNPNSPGSFGTGRREINWDGVPDSRAAPNNLPADFFNVTSPRGAVFTTPGTGFQVSANSGIAPIQFDNIDPSYSSLFTTFSAQRLFTALGSNIVDVNFFIPGSTDPALVRGFGVVFSDVDLATTTSIQFFGPGNVSLNTFFAPNLQGPNETLSFLGVDFGAPVISRVRITNGTDALGVGVTETPTRDLVVMDDFIYAEPVALPTAVPEPATWVLAILGFGLAGVSLRRRRAYA